MELQGSFGSSFLWGLNQKVFIFSEVFVLPQPFFFLTSYIIWVYIVRQVCIKIYLTEQAAGKNTTGNLSQLAQNHTKPTTLKAPRDRWEHISCFYLLFLFTHFVITNWIRWSYQNQNPKVNATLASTGEMMDKNQIQQHFVKQNKISRMKKEM